MMGRTAIFVLCASAVAALTLTSARGADMPPLPYSKTPAPAPVSDYWTGFYVGAHGGYGWDKGSSDITFASFQTAPQGFVGGGQVGYGQRIGSNFYIGSELDGSIATLDGTQQNPGFIGTANSKNKWLASVRARVGWLPTEHLLLFLSAGYGYGSNEFTLQDLKGNSLTLNATKGGAVVGGGLEAALTQHTAIRVEYLKYFLDDMNFGDVIHAKDEPSVIRAAVNYKF